MIFGQMNPNIAAALRGRLGLGVGIKSAGPASYQAPQFPGGMSQYTPQPHAPSQWGTMPQGNTGIVPPGIQSPWSNVQVHGYGMAQAGHSLPTENPIQAPWSLPQPSPIGTPKSQIPMDPGVALPSPSPIGGPKSQIQPQAPDVMSNYDQQNKQHRLDLLRQTGIWY